MASLYVPPMSRRQSALVLAALAAAAVAAGCSSSANTSEPRHVVFSYTCYRARDMRATYHPGQIVAVHWMAIPTKNETTTPSPVRLAATLNGPFINIHGAKTAREGAAVTLHAATVRTTDQAGRARASRILIPASAPRGFYNLRTTVQQEGGIITGVGTILIARS